MSTRWSDGWRLALGTLTALSVPPPRTVDAAVARRTVLLAPAAFLPVAAISAGVGWASSGLGLPRLAAALLVVAVSAWLTRAIHLDGLADTADGLGSGRPAEEALQIMRRGDVGPVGVVALVLMLGAQVVCIAELLASTWGAVVVVVVLCAARGALAVAARAGVPAARPNGLGAVFASCLPTGAAAALGAALALILAAAAPLLGVPWWQGLAAAVAAGLAAARLVAVAVRRLGGITGDVLGAAVEAACTVLLLALAV